MKKQKSQFRILYRLSIDIDTAYLQTQKQTLCLKGAHTQHIY